MADFQLPPGFSDTPEGALPELPPGFREPSTTLPPGFTQVAQEPPSNESFLPGLGKGLASGVSGVEESFGGFLSMGGKLLGVDALDRWGKAIMSGSEEERQKYLPRISRFEDIRNFDDLSDYLAQAVGNIAPSIGTSIAGGLIGGAIGSAIGGPAGTITGAVAGSRALSYILNAGDTYAELVDNGIEAPKAAALAGIPMAILDSIVPIKVGSKVLWMPTKKAVEKALISKSVKNIAEKAVTSSAAKAILKDLSIEGGTEGLQRVIQSATVASQGGKKFMTPETASQILNAAIAGALGGALAGTGGEIFKKRNRIYTPPIPTDNIDIKQVDEIKQIAPIQEMLPFEEEGKPVEEIERIPGTKETVTKPVVVEEKPVVPEEKLPIPEEPQVPTEELPIPEEKPLVEEPTPQDEGPYPIMEDEESSTLGEELFMEELANQKEEETPTITLEPLPKEDDLYPTMMRSVPRFTGKLKGVFFHNFKNKLTYDELKSVGSRPDVHEITQTINSVWKQIEDTLSPTKLSNVPVEVKGLGITTNPHIYGMLTPYVDSQVLFVNPFVAAEKAVTPLRAASRIWYTMVHELAHVIVPKHDESFTIMEGNLLAALGDITPESIQKLGEVYSNEKGELRSDFKETVRLIEKATGRPGDRADPLWSRRQSPESQPAGRREKGIEESVPKPSESALPGSVEPQFSTRQSDPTLLEQHMKEYGPLWKEYTNWLWDQGNTPVDSLVPEGTQLPDTVAGRNLIDVLPELPIEVQKKFLFSKWAKTKGLNLPDAFKDVPLPALYNILKTGKGLEAAGALGGPGGLTDSELIKLYGSLAKFNWLQEQFYTLLQIAERYPKLEPLQRYLGLVRDGWWTTRIRTLRGACGIAQNWLSLGKDRSRRVGEMAIDVSLKSFDEGRALSDNEIVEMATKHGLDEESFEVWKAIDQSFRELLAKMEEAQVAEIYKRASKNQEGQADALARETLTRKEYAKLRNRHYFPWARFGRYRVEIRARADMSYNGKDYEAGDLIYSEPFENERDMLERLDKAQKEFSPRTFKVAPSYVPDDGMAFQGFPTSLFDRMLNEMDLTKQQEIALRGMILDTSPGRAFIKHMKSKKGILGFSPDAMRAYMDYFVHGSNFLAKLQYRYQLQESVADIHRLAGKVGRAGGSDITLEQIYEYASDHLKYAMNPGEEYSALRSGIFTYWFSFVPKQLVVNLSQIPLLTGPYLAATMKEYAGFSDIHTAKVLAKTMKDVVASFRSYKKGLPIPRFTEQEMADIEWGLDREFLSESFASSAAALSSSHVLDRLTTHARGISRIWNSIVRAGVLPFQTSEEYNRLVAFISAIRLAREAGMSTEQAREYGREVVDKTDFEYARWNRMRISRGRKAIFFIFKTFQQHSLYFALTQPGRGRHLLALLLLGGLTGLPGADDLLEMLNALGTVAKRTLGLKGDPRVDLRKDVREFAVNLGRNPDSILYGLARSSFGAENLVKMFGLPFPALDFSGSISMGRIIPGIQPVARVIERGGGDFKQFFTNVAQEVSGAGGMLGMNLTRAVVENSPDSTYWLKSVAPNAIRNLVLAYEDITGGAKDWRGNRVVKFDLTDIEHQGEILGQLMGAMPRRVRERKLLNWERAQAIQFYSTRREILLNLFSAAVKGKDKEARADVVKEIRRHNKNSPRGFEITKSELDQSVKTRFRNRSLTEQGLPTSKRYVQIYKNFNSDLYPVE